MLTDRLTSRGWLRAAAVSRPFRRLLIAVAVLIVADRFEPALLRSAETARYEDPARDFRFENSDLFGLWPLVAALSFLVATSVPIARPGKRAHYQWLMFYGGVRDPGGSAETREGRSHR